MVRLKKKRVVELKIDELSKKGNGLGWLERPQLPPARVEVPFTIPGDLVRVQLFAKRSGVIEARLEEVLTPSPNRIAPRCIHFGTCGGCRLQHLSYSEQLQHKEKWVHHCFEPLLTPSIPVHPIMGGAPWNYRNKMEYSFSSDAAGKKYLGLVMDASRGRVFNLTECHLSNGWFVDVVKAVKQWWEQSGVDAYHMHSNTGSLRTLTLREGHRTQDRMAILTVSGNPDFALRKPHLESFVASVRRVLEPAPGILSIFLRIQQIAKGMPTQMYEMHLFGEDHIRETLHIQIDPEQPTQTINFHISPSAFFQPNPLQAERLYSTALRLAEIPADAVVYDLYCGTGALGLCISKSVKQVIGIELSPESALDARTNATLNGCTNMMILSGAVRAVLGQLEEKKIPRPDVVMVDPPRAGLDPESLQHIVKLGAPKLLYISCNPETQAANVGELQKAGYRIKALQPVDQFPQTAHVENIVVLEK